jgi:hypothetical protein
LNELGKNMAKLVEKKRLVSIARIQIIFYLKKNPKLLN